jgi:DNA processing protein
MNAATDLDYVTLALVPGIGRARLDALLRVFGSPEAVLEAPIDRLKEVPEIGTAAATAIREANRKAGGRVLAQAAKMGAVVLTPRDPRFPEMLRVIPDCPTLLFVWGRLELLAMPCVAIVGSRSHTRYGAEVCRHFAGGLARAGLVVVSGMARGLDAMAHQAALDAGGDTIGVLGNGLGVIYPSANRALYERMRREGCLLTEFPPGERPNAGSFPRRNRLISGLSQVTLVVEAREHSGALITARCAADQGRDVLAVPGPITSPVSMGCNQLVQHGAKPALGLRDVLEEYGISLPDVPSAALPTRLSEDERRVLDILAMGSEHVDEVAQRLGAPLPETLAVLTSLEIRGLVEQGPGSRFRIADSGLRIGGGASHPATMPARSPNPQSANRHPPSQ